MITQLSTTKSPKEKPPTTEETGGKKRLRSTDDTDCSKCRNDDAQAKVAKRQRTSSPLYTSKSNHGSQNQITEPNNKNNTNSSNNKDGAIKKTKENSKDNSANKKKARETGADDARVARLIPSLSFWLGAPNLARDRHLLSLITPTPRAFNPSDGYPIVLSRSTAKNKRTLSDKCNMNVTADNDSGSAAAVENDSMWTPISEFKTFPRVQAVRGCTHADLVAALRALRPPALRVELDASAQKFRVLGLRDGVAAALASAPLRTVWLRNDLPPNAGIDAVGAALKLHGCVAHVKIPRWSDGRAKGLAFVEFDTPQAAAAAVAARRVDVCGVKGVEVASFAEWTRFKARRTAKRRETRQLRQAVDICCDINDRAQLVMNKKEGESRNFAETPTKDKKEQVNEDVLIKDANNKEESNSAQQGVDSDADEEDGDDDMEGIVSATGLGRKETQNGTTALSKLQPPANGGLKDAQRSESANRGNEPTGDKLLAKQRTEKGTTGSNKANNLGPSDSNVDNGTKSTETEEKKSCEQSFPRDVLVEVRGIGKVTRRKVRQHLEDFGALAFVDFNEKNFAESGRKISSDKKNDKDKSNDKENGYSCVARYLHWSGAERAVEGVPESELGSNGSVVASKLSGERERKYWVTLRAQQEALTNRRTEREEAKTSRRVSRREPSARLAGRRK